MSAPEGNKHNPNLTELTKKYGFGAEGGADPSAAAKKGVATRVANGSIRRYLKQLMHYPLNPDVDIRAQVTSSKLLWYLGYDGSRPTLAALAAIQYYQHAVQNGKIMTSLIDQVDGKQIERVVEAKISLAELVAGSFGEASDEPYDSPE